MIIIRAFFKASYMDSKQETQGLHGHAHLFQLVSTLNHFVLMLTLKNRFTNITA